MPGLSQRVSVGSSAQLPGCKLALHENLLILKNRILHIFKKNAEN